MTDGVELSLRFIERHPADAAAVLEGHPAAAAADYLGSAPARLAAPVVAHMLPARAGRCLAELSSEHAAALLREVPPAAAAAILRQMPTAARTALLSALPRTGAAAVKLMLRYPATATGAWVDPLAAAVSADDSVADAWERLRQDGCELEPYIHVVDREGRLAGRVRSAQLLRADPETPVARLQEAVPHALSAGTDLLTARSHAGWADDGPLPLIGRDRRFIGVLRRAALERGLAADPGQHPDAGWAPVLLELAEAYWTGAARALESSLSLLPGSGRRRRE